MAACSDRRGYSISLLPLLLLGGALLLNEQTQTIGRVEDRAGMIDVFDQDSRRLGWGRQHRNGDVEPFDTKGNRIGIWERDRGVIRLDRK